jgi:hypothetical protein
MKYVIHTQFMENYGAHDWDGKGVCPQYWKYKGGDTYIIDVTLQEAQDKSFYASVEKCIEYKNDYSEEYILGSELIDDIDFVESDHVAEWESPICCFLEGDKLMCTSVARKYDMSATPFGERTWVQDADGRSEMQLTTFEEVA